jgi:hypothetical protein
MVNLGVITAFISHMSSYLISHHFGQTILPRWLLLKGALRNVRSMRESNSHRQRDKLES